MSHVLARPHRLAMFVLAALIVLAARTPVAHDLPDEINVYGFIKPVDGRLHFLVRVPLALLEGLGLPKRGPGYLDLSRIEEYLQRATLATAREFVLYENGVRLTPEYAETRISQPSEDAFGSFDQAYAHIDGPDLPETANVFWNQGYFDLHLDFPVASEDSRFALDMRAVPGLAGLLKLFVEFQTADGEVRTYEVHGGHGWLELDPTRYGATWSFMQRGFDRAFTGIELLLLLFCLVLPFRPQQVLGLAWMLAAFALGHWVALLAAAVVGIAIAPWLPPLIGALTALSLAYVALENIVGAWLQGDAPSSLRWRWLIAAALGLLFGFSAVLGLQEDLQFAGPHLSLGLLGFSLGVSAGQIAFLVVVLPLLAVLLRDSLTRRVAVVILSVLIGHTGWHWTLERIEALRFVRWPAIDVSWSGLLLAAIVLAAVVAGGLWLSRLQLQRFQRRF